MCYFRKNQQLFKGEKMKCPKCETELVKTPMSMCLSPEDRKQNFCSKCFHRYSDEDLEKIKDAEMIEEDTRIWKEVKGYK